jgi:predicted TIM-barrel fold metal-dependent hydrolase
MADIAAARPRGIPRIRIARLPDFALIPPIIAIAHAHQVFGPDRCRFGSDWPRTLHRSMDSQGSRQDAN